MSRACDHAGSCELRVKRSLNGPGNRFALQCLSCGARIGSLYRLTLLTEAQQIAVKPWHRRRSPATKRKRDFQNRYRRPHP